MTLDPAVLAALREGAAARTGGRCAYCASYVTPLDLGAVDFFRPLKRGGVPDADNALFACARCNANKGAYWHETDVPHIKLLHPLNDPLRAHLREEEDGSLVPLTPEGEFYVQRIRLDRETLITQRRAFRLLARARELEDALRRRIDELRRAEELQPPHPSE